MKPISPHAHNDTQHCLTFAHFLATESTRLADDVITRFDFGTASRQKVTRLMVRTLVGALADAVRTGDAARVTDWARMARGLYCAETTSTLVSIACDIVVENSERHSPDLAGLLLFLGIVKQQLGPVSGSMFAGAQNVLHEQNAVTEGVLALLRARDEATCTHSRATGTLCRRLATALRMAPLEIEAIVMAGVLHDIGKIATPDTILLKDGPLSSDEWTTMREHAATGADILLEIPSLARYAPVVRAHHERIDGRGYPMGLTGTEIPYEARIVAVADAFHAMVSNRPYRSALAYGEAIDVLARGANRQWDGDVVAVMIEIAVQMRNESADASLTIFSEPAAVRDRSERTG
ncbi:MAG: hypothetical protein NVSMB64_30040 [Candidatus Velthaea sp.]